MDSFFGIGTFEFVFILIFALIFLGPERLPQVMRQVVGFLRKAQELSAELTEQFNDELGDLQELDPRRQLRELDPRRQIQKAIDPPKRKSKSASGTGKEKSRATRTDRSSSGKDDDKKVGDKKGGDTKGDEKTIAPPRKESKGEAEADTSVKDTGKDEEPDKDIAEGTGTDTGREPVREGQSPAATTNDSAVRQNDDEVASVQKPKRRHYAKPDPDTGQISPASGYFAQQAADGDDRSEPDPRQADGFLQKAAKGDNGEVAGEDGEQGGSLSATEADGVEDKKASHEDQPLEENVEEEA